MYIIKYSLAKDGNKKLSEHFTVKEFACKDGSDTVLIDSEMVDILEKLRELVGNKPIIILSGYRTEAYNKKVGGVSESYHMKGCACDVRVEGVSETKVAIYGAMAGAKGIGIYKNSGFTHLDNREKAIVFKEV